MTILDLPTNAEGVLPCQLLAQAIDLGYIDAGDYKIPSSSIQPASLDLRLGDRAFILRCSFLPDTEPVDLKMKPLVLDEIDLRDDGALLQPKHPYLIPLVERLELPPFIRAKANPKSSTGRLDVFTRVITDNSYRFDEIRGGYHGRLYLEVVPLSFPIQVRQGLALNQLRLSVGRSQLTDSEVHQAHAVSPLLYRRGRPVPEKELVTADGLFLSLDLRGDDRRHVGYRARNNTPRLSMGTTRGHRIDDYWEEVLSEDGNRIVLG